MDRSMDSIGSCSLDVDAESSDISDTSGSLNFPTPISIKDITREFTANIRERCSLQTVKNSTTAYVDPVTGQVCIALTQQPPTLGLNNNIAIAGVDPSSARSKSNATGVTLIASPQTPIAATDKKPSYLNLACCVNGYSNITTYDSKIRQDINKSREVSPIRPSSTSLQYCKKSNSLAPPVLLAMPNVNVTSPQPQPHMATANGGGILASIGTKYALIENNNHHTTTITNGDSIHNISIGDDVGCSGDGSVGGGGSSSSKRSFIQQRVERLYGPGALAQGFYSPKKKRDSPQRMSRANGHENGLGMDSSGANSELARKFQELSPSKDYNQFRKKLYSNGRPSIPTSVSSSSSDNVNSENNNIDLPCLRHLSQEFRAQLPIVSPKRSFTRITPPRELEGDSPPSSATLITVTTQNHSTSNGTTIRSTTTTTTTTSTLVNTSLNNHVSISPDFKSQNRNSILTAPAPAPAAGMDEVDRQILVSMEEMPLQTPSPPSKSEKPELHANNMVVGTPITVLPNINAEIDKTVEKLVAIELATPPEFAISNGSAATVIKDAHFFLKQLKGEQARILVLAAEAEKYLDALASNPDITEDTLGLLRAASGKARLLVSQKMKQFEGLCHNNLNSSPEDQFPTTVDDLQGFWDMVYLQVDHIDEIFKDIEILKKNEWKKPKDLELPVATPNSTKTPKPLKHFGKPRTNTPVANGGSSASSGAGSTPSAAALKREAQRKKLLEIKRRNREALIAANASAASPPVEGSGAIEDDLKPLEPIDTKQES